MSSILVFRIDMTWFRARPDIPKEHAMEALEAYLKRSSAIAISSHPHVLGSRSVLPQTSQHRLNTVILKAARKYSRKTLAVNMADHEPVRTWKAVWSVYPDPS